MLRMTRVQLPTLIVIPYESQTLQVLYKNYPGQGFAKLRSSETFTPILGGVNSHLDSHTDFAST